jgi:hypothetical protein
MRKWEVNRQPVYTFNVTFSVSLSFSLLVMEELEEYRCIPKLPSRQGGMVLHSYQEKRMGYYNLWDSH